MCLITRVTRTGKSVTTFEARSLSIADHFDLFILPALMAGGHPALVDIVYDSDDPVSAFRKLVAAGPAVPVPD